MSFTLGSISCPSCSGALELRSLTASDDGLSATGSLSCPACCRRVNLAVQIALVDLIGCPHDGCLRTFESRQGLAQHQRAEHTEALPSPLEPCPECGEPLAAYARLRHRLVCAGPPLADQPAPPPAPTNVCPDCGQHLATGHGLVAHRRSHEEPEPCPGGCGRQIKPSGQKRHAGSCPGPPPLEETPPCPPPAPADAATPGPTTGPPPPTAAAPGAAAAAPKPRRPSRSRSKPAPPPPDPDRFRSCGYTPDPSTTICGADELMFEGPRQRWRSVRLEGGRALLLCPDHATIRGPGLDHSIAVATRSEP